MSQMCGTSTDNTKGTSRWIARELLVSGGVPNEESDVWAFGMVLYVRFRIINEFDFAYLKHPMRQELVKRELPYSNLSTEQQVILAISKGQLPEQPFPEDEEIYSRTECGLWYICRDCWKKRPEWRPSMHEILSDIGKWVVLNESVYCMN